MNLTLQTETAPPTLQTETTPLLRVQGLRKTFRATDGTALPLFENLDFEIAANEIVAIIGHSGSGKSTILSMIAGLEPADAGTMLLEDRPITRPGSDRMMVFQNYSLLPWLTVDGNVRLAVDEAMRDRPAAERAEVVQRYVELVHLEEAARKRPHELSGGMKQRVGIARALAVRPLLLLMDEPFGALDPFTRGRLQDEVLRLFYDEHQTILLVTHDVDEALFMSDRVLILKSNGVSSIAEDLRVPFAHPRDRRALREDAEFHRLRNHLLDLLEQLMPTRGVNTD
jgi:nitrate/nitrite transport system ATP-binding protein